MLNELLLAHEPRKYRSPLYNSTRRKILGRVTRNLRLHRKHLSFVKVMSPSYFNGLVLRVIKCQPYF